MKTYEDCEVKIEGFKPIEGFNPHKKRLLPEQVIPFTSSWLSSIVNWSHIDPASSMCGLLAMSPAMHESL